MLLNFIVVLLAVASAFAGRTEVHRFEKEHNHTSSQHVSFPNHAQQPKSLQRRDLTNLTYLQIGVLYEFNDPDPDWRDYGTMIQSIWNLAKDDINADPAKWGLPSNARIRLDFRDSIQYFHGWNMEGAYMVSAMDSYKDGSIAIVGGSSSDVAIAMAQMLGPLMVPVCSPQAYSYVLSDKTKYPYFFRPNTPAANDVIGVIPLLKNYGWTRFSFIYQDVASGTAYDSALSEAMKKESKLFLANKFTDYYTNDPGELANRAVADGTRVIVVAGNPDWAAKLFWGAYNASVVGNDFVWIFVNDIQDRLASLLKKNLADETQIPELLEDMLVGTLYMSVQRDSTPAREEFWARLPTLNESLYPLINYGGGGDEAPAYACISALAAGWGKLLQQAAADNNSDVNLAALASGELGSYMIPDTFNTGIDTPVGYFNLDQHGDFKGYNLLVALYEKGQPTIGDGGTEIGSVAADLSGFIQRVVPVFRDGSSNPPLTTVPQLPVNPSYESVSAAVILAFTSLGIFATAVTAMLFVVFMKHEAIRRTSLPFSLLILLGITISYTTLFPHIGIPTPAHCIGQTWLPPIGFCLCFSSIAVKSWRLYRIFNNVRKNYAVKTSQLFAYTGAMLSLEVLILIVWTAYDPPRPIVLPISQRQSIYLCRSSTQFQQNIFEGFLYAINSALLAFVLLLTWLNRTVATEYNETLYIGAAVWNFVALMSIGLPLVYIQSLYEYQFVIRQIIVLLVTTFTLLVLFAPVLLRIAGVKTEKVDLMNSFANNVLKSDFNSKFGSTSTSESLITNSTIVPAIERGGLWTLLNRWETMRVFVIPKMNTLIAVQLSNGRAFTYNLVDSIISEASNSGDEFSVVVTFPKTKRTFYLSFNSHEQRTAWMALIASAGGSHAGSATGSKDPNRRTSGLQSPPIKSAEVSSAP
ncbi:uncharacterized protein SPPG_01867 [Spizellomyces punctatus DAOM BR117]|uniref:G-protein coupled receptors family 3 profile domain-containing protein n=1 Tax=Spizellomyces punctatus (strain DAOM BR117) TaxID=645134 RepID=A0A0L0HP89_SPIPD|nr:uncharacterized protein SPPG_01867 [Spizellomyces punctatus DAOM BR117]KND02785.1 hypothetical protein SPPG_01867 [Spizellomyces punctatus DAOM BR117]|eukprot:XP_016610824.1 hypothetical protein SPPG_01867 [Spizellomyces punctatus DAOM BR117]